MMSTTMNHKTENMVVFPAAAPQQGEEPKTRRRRRRNTRATGVSRKRKLSPDQLTLLELNFGTEQKLETDRKDKLAMELGLDPRHVAIWFQNRRARWRTRKVGEELSQLKISYDKLVLDKNHLQSEVLILRERLLEAESIIQQMVAESKDVISSNSPVVSTVTVETEEAPLFGELGDLGFEAETYEDMNYLPNYSAECFSCPCSCHYVDWVNYLCMN